MLSVQFPKVSLAATAPTAEQIGIHAVVGLRTEKDPVKPMQVFALYALVKVTLHLSDAFKTDFRKCLVFAVLLREPLVIIFLY